jgi:hypothetical protein
MIAGDIFWVRIRYHVPFKASSRHCPLLAAHCRRTVQNVKHAMKNLNYMYFDMFKRGAEYETSLLHSSLP